MTTRHNIAPSWEAEVTEVPLTGYVVGSDAAIADTDTVLEAFEKVQAQLNAAKQSAALTATAFGAM
jgi:hypothetical protein